MKAPAIPCPVPGLERLTPDEYEAYRWDENRWSDPQRPHHRCVYRYWNDLSPVGHQLLYVGFSHDFFQRDAKHQRSSWKWRRQATRMEIAVYPDEQSALHAEWLAIIAELPVYNTAHTDVDRWVEQHGEWIDFVEDRYSPAKLAADRRCADAIEALFHASP